MHAPTLGRSGLSAGQCAMSMFRLPLGMSRSTLALAPAGLQWMLGLFCLTLPSALQGTATSTGHHLKVIAPPSWGRHFMLSCSAALSSQVRPCVHGDMASMFKTAYVQLDSTELMHMQTAALGTAGKNLPCVQEDLPAEQCRWQRWGSRTFGGGQCWL